MAALCDGEPFRAERARLRPGAHLRSIRAAGGGRRPGRFDAAGNAEISSRMLGRVPEFLEVPRTVASVQGWGLFRGGPRGEGAKMYRDSFAIRSTLAWREARVRAFTTRQACRNSYWTQGGGSPLC